MRGETCAFNCGSNGVLIEGIEGSTPPGEAKNFAAAVVPVIRISANTRNGRSDYLSKMPIDTAYRNTWIIIHVKGVNKQFSYREQNALSIIKTDERAIPSART